MYNSCYYSELEMNEIAETLLDIFRKNEKNDRQVAIVFAFEIIYLFIYATCKHALLHLNQISLLVQFPFLQFGGVFVVILVDSYCFLFIFCRGLFPSTRPVLSLLPIILRWFSI